MFITFIIVAVLHLHKQSSEGKDKINWIYIYPWRGINVSMNHKEKFIKRFLDFYGLFLSFFKFNFKIYCYLLFKKSNLKL